MMLLQAIQKGKIFETIIEKATELGAFSVVPLLAERVTARIDQRETAHKLEKWRLAAIEAIKQCGSPWLPTIQNPVTPQKYVTPKPPFALPFLPPFQPTARHP